MRAIMVACVVLLAGCTTPEANKATIPEDEPCVVESAEDYACQELDEGKRPDEVAHRHNYWGGAETVRLIEDEQSFGTPIVTNCDATPMEVFRPPEESTVYQGTGLMDIAMTMAKDPGYFAGQAELWVKRADQVDPQYVADFVDGAEITLEVPYNASDLPHQTLSAWEFWVYVNPEPTTRSAYCAVQPRGLVGLAVDIHNTLEIQPFPGHPDHWNNQTELPLLDDFATYTVLEENLGACLGGDGSDPDGSCEMHSEGFGPRDGHIVPPDAEVVTITLEAEPDPGYEDIQLGLEYHGADTREFTRVDSVEREDTTAHYEIDATGIGDGPYAEQSQWRLRVVVEGTGDVYRGDWSLIGTVSKTP